MSLTEVNNDGDSSDSENENADQDGSESELSFESDDEGNYQQNLNKQHQLTADDGDDDEFVEEEEDEDVDDEENVDDDEEVDDDEDVDDGAAYNSDDSEELSFDDSDSDISDSENAPSSSNKVPKPKSKSNEKVTQNGDVKSDDVKISKEKTKKLEISSNGPNAVEEFKNELNKSKGSSTKNVNEDDEYEKHDTDDEEDIRNTVGNIPMQWYDEYKHIGYDWDAKKIIKPPKRDQLDDFLKRMEDPNFWRTVKDPQTGQEVILSDADIELIKRINSRRIPEANFDDYTVCKWNYFSCLILSMFC